MNKKIKLMAIAFFAMTSFALAQTGKPVWKEMKAFHAIMSPVFHPADEGNFTPLKTKSDSLLLIAKNWYASPIPADFKPKETKETLAQLVKELTIVDEAVKAGTDNKQLMKLLTIAHDTFHKVAGECKKTEE